MRILILNGSPRPDSVSTTYEMCRMFADGACGAGHDVTILPVGRMDIGGCRGCEYCHGKGNGACIQDDDEQQVIDGLFEAGAVVFASPIYYFTLTAQLQAAVHRTYASDMPRNVKTALLLSSGSTGVYDAVQAQYGHMARWYGWDDLGCVTRSGATSASQVESQIGELVGRL